MTTKPTLPPRSKSFTVAPSPFNSIKFELGVILCIGLLLLPLTTRIINSDWLQLVVLAAYGLIGTAWLLIRTYRILVRQQTAARQGNHEAQ